MGKEWELPATSAVELGLNFIITTSAIETMRYIFAWLETYILCSMRAGFARKLLAVPPDRPPSFSIWCMSKAQQPRPSQFDAHSPHHLLILCAALLTIYVPTLL